MFENNKPEHGRNDVETFNIRKTLMVEANIIARKSCWLNIICVNNIIRHNIHTRCHGFFSNVWKSTLWYFADRKCLFTYVQLMSTNLRYHIIQIIILFICTWELQRHFVEYVPKCSGTFCITIKHQRIINVLHTRDKMSFQDRWRELLISICLVVSLLIRFRLHPYGFIASKLVRSIIA